MQIVAQNIDNIVEGLRPIAVDWQDDVARNVTERLLQIPIRSSYSASDLHELLDEDFNQDVLIVRLLLGLSKDAFEAQLKATLGQSGSGVTRYRRDPDTFIQTLIRFWRSRFDGFGNQSYLLTGAMSLLNGFGLVGAVPSVVKGGEESWKIRSRPL
jgi:hypothetical protein